MEAKKIKHKKNQHSSATDLRAGQGWNASLEFFLFLSTEMRINLQPLPCFIDAASREKPRKWELVAALHYSALRADVLGTLLPTSLFYFFLPPVH